MTTPLRWRLVRLTTVLVYLFMFLPIAAVILLSFNPQQYGGLSLQGFSLQWYQELQHNEAIRAAARTSLTLGAQTAIISSILGVMASMAMMRFDFPGKTFMNAVLVMPILMP